jgi:hypothetical protein
MSVTWLQFMTVCLPETINNDSASMHITVFMYALCILIQFIVQQDPVCLNFFTVLQIIILDRNVPSWNLCQNIILNFLQNHFSHSYHEETLFASMCVTWHSEWVNPSRRSSTVQYRCRHSSIMRSEIHDWVGPWHRSLLQGSCSRILQGIQNNSLYNEISIKWLFKNDIAMNFNTKIQRCT